LAPQATVAAARDEEARHPLVLDQRMRTVAIAPYIIRWRPDGWTRAANSTPGPPFGSMTRLRLRLKSCFWGFGTLHLMASKFKQAPNGRNVPKEDVRDPAADSRQRA